MKPLLAIVLSSLALVADEPRIPTEERLKILETKIAEQDALIALLQSPAYRAYMLTGAATAQAVRDAEKRVGCSIDPRTLECAKPEAKK